MFETPNLLGLGFRVIMENQMGKKMEHEMETGIIMVYIRFIFFSGGYLEVKVSRG